MADFLEFKDQFETEMGLAQISQLSTEGVSEQHRVKPPRKVMKKKVPLSNEEAPE